MTLCVLHDLRCEVILLFNSRPILVTRDGIEFHGDYDSNTPYFEINLIVDLVRNNGYCRQPNPKRYEAIHSIGYEYTGIDDMDNQVESYENDHIAPKVVENDELPAMSIANKPSEDESGVKECIAPVVGKITNDESSDQDDSSVVILTDDEDQKYISEVKEVVINKVKTGQLDRVNDSSIGPNGLVTESYDSDRIHTQTPRMTPDQLRRDIAYYGAVNSDAGFNYGIHRELYPPDVGLEPMKVSPSQRRC